MSAADPGSPALRASDAERERAATQLREHFAAGRLAPEELDERLDAAYAARTVPELQTLLRDLPPLPAAHETPDLDPAHERAKRRVLHGVGSWLLISLVCVGIWLATGADASFWPRWIIIFGAIRLVFLTWSQLGPGARDDERLGRGGAAEGARPRHRRR
jgi:hypothetical protein